MIDEFVQQKVGGAPAACLHVLLDGIQLGSVVDNKSLKANGIIAEELRHLYRSRAQLGETVIFYQNNIAVAAPWEQDPILWSDNECSTASTPFASLPKPNNTSSMSKRSVPVSGDFALESSTALNEVDASARLMLTDLFYEKFRDFNIGEIEAKQVVGSPEDISKLYQGSEVAHIITEEEFAAIRAYKLGFDKHIDPCLGKVKAYEKRKNTLITYIASGLSKLKEAGCKYFPEESSIERFFIKNPQLIQRFREASILTEVMVPIPQLPDCHVEKEADSDRVFYLEKNNRGEYEIIGKVDGKKKVGLKGVFSYVILPDEPDRVYCGLGNGQQNSKAELNEYRYFNPCYVEGHSSLAQGKDVLYAGDFLFEDGQLKLWTNGSGHYKPIAERRIGNLTQAVKRILPEALFKGHDDLAEDQVKALNSYIQISEEDERCLKEIYANSRHSDSNSESDSGDDDLSVYNKRLVKTGLRQLPASPKRHLVNRKESEKYSNDNDCSQRKDVANSAYIEQLRKKNGLKGGGPVEEKNPGDTCAPIYKTMEKKPRDDSSDDGGTGAGKLSASQEPNSGRDGDHDTRPDRPSGVGGVVIPPMASLKKSAETLGPSVTQLQEKLKIALNSGAEIKAVQIGRMLEFAILLAKSTPAAKREVINAELFKQANKLLSIPSWYFNSRFPAPGAARLPMEIMLSLMQSLRDCVSVRVSVNKDQSVHGQGCPNVRSDGFDSVNIFATPEKQEQATVAINLLIGTEGQRREKIAADNCRIENAENERLERKNAFSRHAAELSQYSANENDFAYERAQRRRVLEESERQNMISRSQAERQAQYENRRAAKGGEWSGILAGIALHETYQANKNNARRKQDQEDGWRSVQSPTITSSGISSPEIPSRSSRLASITSAEINMEISRMYRDPNFVLENTIVVPFPRFTFEEPKIQGDFESAEQLIRVLDRSEADFYSQAENISRVISLFKEQGVI